MHRRRRAEQRGESSQVGVWIGGDGKPKEEQSEREEGPRSEQTDEKNKPPPVQWALTGGECLSQDERTERWVCCRDS